MNKIYDVILIGSGAANMSAAVYAARAGLEVLIIERGMYGGQMQNTGEIENYIGINSITGSELSDSMFNQVNSMSNVEFSFGNVIGIECNGTHKIVKIKSKEFTSKTVIIGTGVKHKKLGVDGEDIFMGRGVSNCGYCDGNFFEGQHVAVVGGGNSAVEDALYLSDIVDKVTLIHRRGELRAEKVLQDRLFRKDNIEILWHTEVESINGNKKVEELSLINKDGHKFNLDVRGVFIYVGVEPISEPFIDLNITDRDGYIVTEDNMSTKVSGIFAAGDIRKDSIRQIVAAVNDGAIAAISAKKLIDTIL